MMQFLGMIGLWQILLLLILLFLLATPIIALLDILKNEFKGNNKLIWTIVVLFGSFIGAGLYYLIGRGQRINVDQPKEKINGFKGNK